MLTIQQVFYIVKAISKEENKYLPRENNNKFTQRPEAMEKMSWH